MFSTQTTAPTLIQLELAYDPMVLTNVAIQPGNFFPNYNVTLNSVNPRTGRISFAIESASGKVPQNKTDSIAILTFIPINEVWKRQTTLSFLPKTMMRVQNSLLPLSATSAATFTFLSTATPSASIQPTR